MAERDQRTVSRRLFLRNAAAAGAGLYLARAPTARAAGSGRAGPSVAVIGGGVAGLTAAHELAERGFRITVYERKALGARRAASRFPEQAPVAAGTSPPSTASGPSSAFTRTCPT